METVLKLTKADAVKLYPTAVPEFKKILETTFGLATFSGKITDRLTCLLDCFEYLGLEPAGCTPYKNSTIPRRIAVNGFEEAVIAVQAINENWIPNYDDHNELKYEIWWDMRNNRLAFNSVDCWHRYSGVGSRLCFRSRALAEWAANQEWFVEICEKFMVVTK